MAAKKMFNLLKNNKTMENNIYLRTVIAICKTKNSIKTAFVLLLAMLLQSATVHAQEMIRSMEGSATDFTLARISTPFQQWIVYNENANMSLFGRMDTSGLANVFVKTDPQIHVKDMELSGGILYFCGNMSDNSAKGEVGVMGFFKIADLSSPSTMQISYIKFKEFKELRKLTYYATSLTKHVPMVGTGADGRDYIVDVFYGGIEPSMNYWRREWMYIPNIDAEFDDIACIKDYVVVSSRIENETEVQMCFIPKTGLEGRAFFSPALFVDMVKVPDQPIGRVLLQKIIGNDDVYAFYRHGSYLDACHFVGEQNLASCHIAILHTLGYFPEYFELKDVCIDKNQDEISVLLRKVYAMAQYHQILHIPTLLPSIGGSVAGHEYSPYISYEPMSLCGGKDYHTVTMGRFMNNWGMARVVNSQFEECSEHIQARVSQKDLANDPVPKKYAIIKAETEVLPMNVTELDLPVLFWCSDYARKDNENINK